MNGAECLLHTLQANHISLCLMNPGTSEMQFVSALDRVDGVRGVLCLHENVCSGAADGYARVLRRPAATLLHLGPGLANALSNFHNARKARSPIVNIVGEHSTAHSSYDAPLTADIEALARPVSSWVETLDGPGRMGSAAAAAIEAAVQPPGQIATLIIPADHSWSEAGPAGPAVAAPHRTQPNPIRIAEAARRLRSGEPTALLLSGSALTPDGLLLAGRTGVPVFVNRYAAAVPRGFKWTFARRIAYFPEPAEAQLAGLRHLLTFEAEAPVSFFGYPGRRSTLAPEHCEVLPVTTESENSLMALAQLAAKPAAAATFEPVPFPPDGPLTPASLGQVVAALLPEDAIVTDEMVSSAEPVNAALEAARPHLLLPVTGGSIGQGLPVALGAALAAPERKVVALEADGSALYTFQALWTMAREGCNVTIVLFNNRRYRILDVEMQRTGAGPVGPRAEAMIDLRNPDLDWVKLAEGLGVEGVRATTTFEFAAHFAEAMNSTAPRLIEAVLA